MYLTENTDMLVTVINIIYKKMEQDYENNKRFNIKN